MRCRTTAEKRESKFRSFKGQFLITICVRSTLCTVQLVYERDIKVFDCNYEYLCVDSLVASPSSGDPVFS